jgi:hypothetical protein
MLRETYFATSKNNLCQTLILFYLRGEMYDLVNIDVRHHIWNFSKNYHLRLYNTHIIC